MVILFNRAWPLVVYLFSYDKCFNIDLDYSILGLIFLDKFVLYYDTKRIYFTMSVLKAHKSLCYYVLFFHVQTINKALNEWITSLLIFFKGLIKENLLFFIFYFLGQNIIAMMINSKSFLVRWVYLEHSFWLFVWW